VSTVPDLTAGLCLQSDPDMWNPETGADSRVAKAICRRCDVMDACLAWALPQVDLGGVWGATTRLERRAIRAAQAREVAA
jgi:WhiB family redox-sensing transcriptional regulator